MIEVGSYIKFSDKDESGKFNYHGKILKKDNNNFWMLSDLGLVMGLPIEPDGKNVKYSILKNRPNLFVKIEKEYEEYCLSSPKKIPMKKKKKKKQL